MEPTTNDTAARRSPMSEFQERLARHRSHAPTLESESRSRRLAVIAQILGVGLIVAALLLLLIILS